MAADYVGEFEENFNLFSNEAQRPIMAAQKFTQRVSTNTL